VAPDERAYVPRVHLAGAPSGISRSLFFLSFFHLTRFVRARGVVSRGRHGLLNLILFFPPLFYSVNFLKTTAIVVFRPSTLGIFSSSPDPPFSLYPLRLVLPYPVLFSSRTVIFRASTQPPFVRLFLIFFPGGVPSSAWLFIRDLLRSRIFCKDFLERTVLPHSGLFSRLTLRFRIVRGSTWIFFSSTSLLHHVLKCLAPPMKDPKRPHLVPLAKRFHRFFFFSSAPVPFLFFCKFHQVSSFSSQTSYR